MSARAERVARRFVASLIDRQLAKARFEGDRLSGTLVPDTFDGAPYDVLAAVEKMDSAERDEVAEAMAKMAEDLRGGQ